MDRSFLRSFTIDADARAAVYERSRFVCEQCGEFEAVHVHHLTYERAGHELPEDLQHVCIGCHCAAHPKKATDILAWEMERQERIAAGGADEVIETVEEWLDLEELELDPDEESRREEFEEQQREKERERERELNEPAWNLGHFTASGYCIEDVEAEELRRGKEIQYGSRR